MARQSKHGLFLRVAQINVLSAAYLLLQTIFSFRILAGTTTRRPTFEKGKTHPARALSRRHVSRAERVPGKRRESFSGFGFSLYAPVDPLTICGPVNLLFPFTRAVRFQKIGRDFLFGFFPLYFRAVSFLGN
jgi:hypothetical protein